MSERLRFWLHTAGTVVGAIVSSGAITDGGKISPLQIGTLLVTIINAVAAADAHTSHVAEKAEKTASNA